MIFPDNSEKLFEAQAVVEHVGRQILAWRYDQSSKSFHCKSEFKTEADRKAHALLEQGLSKLFKEIPIVSEESDSHNPIRPSRYWLIDPIDGTASWYNGFDGFACQAAYIEEEIPKYGVINAPALGMTWTAMLGCGAYKNNKLLPGLQHHSRLILTDNYPEPRGIAGFLASDLKITSYLESGSIGLKCALVADGSADLFVKDVVVRDWDVAPAAVILQEVGAYLSDSFGGRILFNGSYQKHKGVVVYRDKKLSRRVFESIDKYKNSI